MVQSERLAVVETELQYIKSKVDSIDNKLPDELHLLPSLHKRVYELEQFKNKALGIIVFVAFVASILVSTVNSLPGSPETLDVAPRRFEYLKSQRDWKAPLILKTCGVENAYATTSKIIVCAEILNNPAWDDDKIFLAILHEEGHVLKQHVNITNRLLRSLDIIKAERETQIFKSLFILAILRQHEYEADTYSYEEYLKIKPISKEICDIYALLGPINISEDDKTSSHPALFKRKNVCLRYVK
jgi:hypothetical protein